jgi:rubrerythrin
MMDTPDKSVQREEDLLTCKHCGRLTERTPLGRLCPACKVHFTFSESMWDRRN